MHSQAFAEQHARQEQQLRLHTQTIIEQQARQQEQLRLHSQEIEKQNEGIRGLIIVARTCLNSFTEVREGIQELRASIRDLREAQASTDEKLNILIETVDRIIRHRNGKE
jgi:hypothetical protein